MPPKSRRSRRKQRRPNVFVQENQPQSVEEPELYDDGADAPDGDAAGETSAPAAAPQHTRRLRSQRIARQARARSEVFTRTLNVELRKMGILGAGILVTLAVLAVVL